MKRGFLNTDKAKLKLAAVTDIPIDHNDKGKVKEEETLELLPSDFLDLHTLPPSIKTRMLYPADKTRFIFRHWPRDPNGKPILPSDIHGKEAGNGQNLWGATLYDFYFVRRIPSNIHALTISTGSKITNVMKHFGELDHAQDEIAWASREADPVEIPAWDPAQVIMAHERHVHASSMKTDVQTLDAPKTASIPIEERAAGAVKDPLSCGTLNEPNSKPIDTQDDVGMRQLPPDIPVESPFHPSHYPSPWPLVPFESPHTPFLLQRGLPTHLLPRTLHVHDPWRLLNAVIDYSDKHKKAKEESWSSKTDHVRTYTLMVPSRSEKLIDEASHAATVVENEALKLSQSIFITPQDTEGPTEQPAIRVFLPERPRKLTTVPEAHLYLSPKGRLGTGNHSIVYEADLELPRDLFCESTYCKRCLDEQIKVEVDRLKESGEWERQMDEAAKKYGGTTRGGNTSPNAPSSSSDKIPPRHVGFVSVTLEHVPMQTVDMVATTKLRNTPPPDAPSEHFAIVSDSKTNRHVQYDGLVVPIHVNIQWQNPLFPETICMHEAKKKKPVPRTATFRVAAKLSLPKDPHLQREANNYHKFPAHFFQHWSGYNVIAPLHDPTPVSALVPQFFGYYKQAESDGEEGYSSPILLMEHCGKPIRVDKLSIDDRHECAALLFRFHNAGWHHGSFAERNILMQKRHPVCSPLEADCRCGSPHLHRRRSFRLIDFGRSVEWSSYPSQEEMTGKELFGIM